jgi:hypothetical protein
MISKILNAHPTTEPWKHYVLEDVFSDDEWIKIVEAAAILTNELQKGKASIRESIELDDARCAGIPESTNDIIQKHCDIILKNHIEILKKLGNYDENIPYTVFAHWSVLKNFWFKIHTDLLVKAMTIAVYVSPKKSFGTIMYSDNTTKAYHSIVPWKPNNGLLFSAIENNSWHNYHQYGDSPRITLNFYIRTY